MTFRRLSCGVAAFHHSHPIATQAGEQNGVAGAACPRVARLAFDVSQALLWCRWAPPQPPDDAKA